MTSTNRATVQVARLTWLPLRRLADFSEIWIHTCSYLLIVGRPGARAHSCITQAINNEPGTGHQQREIKSEKSRQVTRIKIRDKDIRAETRGLIASVQLRYICGKVAASTAYKLECLKNLPGVVLVCLRKATAKWLWLENPTDRPTSATEVFPILRSAFDLSIRSFRMYW